MVVNGSDVCVCVCVWGGGGGGAGVQSDFPHVHDLCYS